jgi:hypothetical protein
MDGPPYMLQYNIRCKPSSINKTLAACDKTKKIEFNFHMKLGD